MKRSSTKAKESPAHNAGVESRSLAKGLSILEKLGEVRSSMSLTEISRFAGLGKVSTLRLLRTLETTGHLVRDGNDNYSVDAEWPSVGHQMLLRRVRECASPYLRSLSTQFGETVALAFLFDDHIRVVDVIESAHNIRMSNFKGRILQPYASSLGKAITAFQAPERMQALLDTYGIYYITPNTITDFQAIQEDFACIRERGFAWDREETVPGGICIAAPIRTAVHGVIASVSVSTPVARFSSRMEEDLPQLMPKTATALSVAIDEA